jgi:hypothetical protein
MALDAAMHRTLYGGLAALVLALSWLPMVAQPAGAPRWITYGNGHGTMVDLPANVFTIVGGAPPVGNGRRFRTADGRADLSVYTLRNEERETPRSYLERHLKSEFSNLDYDRVSDEFFAVSGIVRGKTFYSRCNFEGPRGTMHCLYLNYPAAETHAWDGLVTRMSRSLRGTNSASR